MNNKEELIKKLVKSGFEKIGRNKYGRKGTENDPNNIKYVTVRFRKITGVPEKVIITHHSEYYRIVFNSFYVTDEVNIDSYGRIKVIGYTPLNYINMEDY